MKIDFRNTRCTFDKVEVGELFKTNDMYLEENEQGDEVWNLEDNYYIKIRPIVCDLQAFPTICLKKVYNTVNIHNGKLRAIHQDKMVEIINCSCKSNSFDD